MTAHRTILVTAITIAMLAATSRARANEDAPPPPPAKPDLSGLHDFDFERGDWRVHHRVKRATGEWQEFGGTSNDRGLMDGFANVEDNLFHRPNGDSRGVALRAYDSKTAQWGIWWLDGRNPFGAMDPPVKGKFENGVGNFYADGMLNGKQTRTRYTWSHITPTSAQWEQALSTDAGKTWDTNWIMEFERVSADVPKVTAQASSDSGGIHAFDLRTGDFRAHHRRLKERLADSHEWIEFDGTQHAWLVMDGAGNVDENNFEMPGGAAFRGVTLRAYDATSDQWAIWWLDGREPHGDLDPPVKGKFENGVGTFYADDTLRGKPIRVRFTWSHISDTTAHWEQAFSPDGGTTWEMNWETDFQRMK